MGTSLRLEDLPVFVAALTTMLLINSQEAQAQNFSDRPIVLGLGPGEFLLTLCVYALVLG